MKRFFVTLFLICLCLPIFGQTDFGPYDAGAARKNLSNVPSTVDLSINSLTLADKVQAAWADILGDVYASGSLHVAGIGKFSDGTATAPSITFDSSSNTGIYYAGTNHIGMSCGGASSGLFSSGEFYIIRPTGNIGDSANLYFTLRNALDESTNYGQISVGVATSTAGAYSGSLRFSNAVAGILAERMRISSAGNILLGTTTDDGAHRIQASSSSGKIFRFYTNNGEFTMVRESLANATSVGLETLIPTLSSHMGKITFTSGSNGAVIDVACSNGTTAIMSDPFSKAAITDTAGKICFINDGDGTVSIKNNSGASVTYELLWLGR